VHWANINKQDYILPDNVAHFYNCLYYGHKPQYSLLDTLAPGLLPGPLVGITYAEAKRRTLKQIEISEREPWPFSLYPKATTYRWISTHVPARSEITQRLHITTLATVIDLVERRFGLTETYTLLNLCSGMDYSWTSCLLLYFAAHPWPHILFSLFKDYSVFSLPLQKFIVRCASISAAVNAYPEIILPHHGLPIGDAIDYFEVFKSTESLVGFIMEESEEINVYADAKELADDPFPKYKLSNTGMGWFPSQEEYLTHYTEGYRSLFTTKRPVHPEATGLTDYLDDFTRYGTNGMTSKDKISRSDGTKIRFTKSFLTEKYSVSEIVAGLNSWTVMYCTALKKPEHAKVRMAMTASPLSYFIESWLYECTVPHLYASKYSSLGETPYERVARLGDTMLELQNDTPTMPFDFQAFDHQPTLAEIDVQYRVNQDYSLSSVQYEGWDRVIVARHNAILEVPPDRLNPLQKFSLEKGGILSGIRGTSANGLGHNAGANGVVEAVIRSDLQLPLQTRTYWAQGDDMLKSFYSLPAALLDRLIRRAIGCEGADNKFYIATKRGDFLRTGIRGHHCIGILARSIVGGVMRKPTSMPPTSMAEEISARLTSASNIYRRSLGPILVQKPILLDLIEHAVLRTAKIGSLGLRAQDVARIPTLNDGLGLLPPRKVDYSRYLKVGILDYKKPTYSVSDYDVQYYRSKVLASRWSLRLSTPVDWKLLASESLSALLDYDTLADRRRDYKDRLVSYSETTTPALDPNTAWKIRFALKRNGYRSTLYALESIKLDAQDRSSLTMWMSIVAASRPPRLQGKDAVETLLLVNKLHLTGDARKSALLSALSPEDYILYSDLRDRFGWRNATAVLVGQLTADPYVQRGMPPSLIPLFVDMYVSQSWAIIRRYSSKDLRNRSLIWETVTEVALRVARHLNGCPIWSQFILE